MANQREIPVHSLAPDPVNPRFDLGDLSELVESIRDKGIIQPLLVRPGTYYLTHGRCQDCGADVPRHPSRLLAEHLFDGRPCPGGSEPGADDWFIVAGHRRTAAVKKVLGSESDPARLKQFWTVPCIIRTDLTSKAEILLTMIEENYQRKNLSPMEEAHAFQQLMFEGMPASRIARRVGRRKETVERRLALTGLPDRAQKQLHTGQLTLQEAERLVRLSPERQQRVLRAVSVEQELVAAELGIEAVDDRPKVAKRLRENYLADFLSGARKPSDDAVVLREVVNCLAGGLPKATVKSWLTVLGIEDVGDLPGVAPVRALIGLAVTVEGSLPGVYDLMEALGYTLQPVEKDLLSEVA